MWVDLRQIIAIYPTACYNKCVPMLQGEQRMRFKCSDFLIFKINPFASVAVCDLVVHSPQKYF